MTAQTVVRKASVTIDAAAINMTLRFLRFGECLGGNR